MKWEIRPFGELYATPSRNGLMRPSKERGSGYKMINMGELFAYPIIKNPEMERVQVSDIELPKYRIEKGDLLFARQSLVLEGAGKCSIVAEIEDPTVYESHLIRVRLNKKLCDPFFYYHFFNSQVGAGFVQQIVNQVAAAGIRGSDLEKLKVIYPPLPVQQKVAAILSAYDDLIENNNKRITLLEKAAEEIYREWFVRMRFPGWEQVKLVKGIPEGWDRTPIKNISSEIKGNVKINNIDPNTRYLGLEHLPRKSIAITSFDTISSVYSDKLLFKEGDILFGKIRPYLHKVALAHFSGACSSDTIIIRPKQKEFEGFLLFTVFSETFIELATVASKGTKMPRADWDFLKKLDILFPPKPILEVFQDKFGTHFEAICKLLSQNELLKQSRDLLLPRLISGKLSVEALDIRFPPSMIAQ
ncbi:MAG TPA: restriction endonuclease subunit S [Anaerolineales bacterium]|nr:restriction endonuclease subunit S [Anaerolineales bacterium]